MYRTYLDSETISDAYILGDDDNIQFKFHFVELPWKENQRWLSCIPEGKYQCQKEGPTDTFPYEHFSVLNVPNRDGIKIHIANFVSQLAGCLAPGKDLVDMNNDRLPDVNYSSITLKKLVEILPDKFMLEIYKDE